MRLEEKVEQLREITKLRNQTESKFSTIESEFNKMLKDFAFNCYKGEEKLYKKLNVFPSGQTFNPVKKIEIISAEIKEEKTDSYIIDYVFQDAHNYIDEVWHFMTIETPKDMEQAKIYEEIYLSKAESELLNKMNKDKNERFGQYMELKKEFEVS